MTDNEIIKANDLCSKMPQQCKDCPFCKFDDCVRELAEETIDLINRQKAEIESNKAKIKISAECIARQDKEIERLTTASLKTIASIKKMYATAKAEAFKEFWNELKSRNTMDDRIVSVASGDNLVKEMVGDDSGN